MTTYTLLGRGRELDKQPVAEWQAAVRRGAGNMRHRLDFMSAEHHAVRNFAVTALPRFNRPIPLTEVASHVRLPVSRVQAIAEELERHLFFLVRDEAGDIAWAFPVTAERTPHEMQLSTGERAFGACAEDTFAAAFVLGRLLGRKLRIDIRSICAQSGRPLRLTVASDLSWRGDGESAQPLLFTPHVDWNKLRAPNIIDDY
jgi:hypothetical protein